LPAGFEDESRLVELAVEQAIKESEKLSGKEVTPFLLKRVAELTDSVSMKISKSCHNIPNLLSFYRHCPA
jgi:pseudouridine-5'-phosphate glycosidase